MVEKSACWDGEILNSNAGLLQCFVQIEIQAKDKNDTNFAPFATKARLPDLINLEDDINTRSLWSLFFFMIKIEGKRSRWKLARNC